MGWVTRSAVGAIVTAATMLAGSARANGQDAVPAPEAPANAGGVHQPAEFAGRWDYNAAESVDAGTGRPEQAPRSATQRGVGPAGGRGAAPAGRPSVPPPGTPSRGTFGEPGVPLPATGPTPDMVRESRNLARDLTEISESLDIKVTADTISFTDDLARERTYPTNGSKQSYQIGAARYDARVFWADSQLRKEIEGRYGFKMVETYFLSPDARRLFLIIRVGDQRPNQRIVGANRVYDRID